MSTKDFKDTYATKDLYLAAFLWTKKMLIEKLERYGREGESPVYFIFEDKKKCEELENAFWNGMGDDIMVNAKDYFTAIRDLRSRVFSVVKLVGKRERSLTF